MVISDHISFKEFIKSNTAQRLGIENNPGAYEVKCARDLAFHVFEPLRKWVGGPIRINSFFRSPDLNKAIGGSKKSQHCYGQAMDLDDTHGFKTNAEMFNYIKDNLDYDQLIWEFGTDENPDWVHVSYVGPGKNRKRNLRASRDKKKTVYTVI
jgi:zinc D-Ala-D-Ala carboxypeptidase